MGGGKRQLLPLLRAHYPADFSRYIEPFLGSGAVFFDLYNASRLEGRRAMLVDDNADLIGCYHALRDRSEEVIAELQALATDHEERGDAFFYEVRDARFNPARAGGAPYTPALAAMLIYLNRTGFNGLFRLNRHGAFNVPVGRYTNPRICDPEHLRAVAHVLRSDGVTIERGSFEAALESARSGDFVYCDPPYAPLSATASFAQYTAQGFSALDQLRLQRAVTRAAKRGASVVVSNSSAPEIEALYGSVQAQRAGLMIRRVEARRAINSRANGRGAIAELIISNMQPGVLPAIRPKMARAGLARGRRRVTLTTAAARKGRDTIDD